MISNKDLGAARWRKSSHSGASNGDCVEVSDGFPGAVPVRDSKAQNGPALIFSSTAWRSFLAGVSKG